MNHGFAIRTRLYTCTSVVPSSDKQCSLYKQVYRISKLFYKLKAVMSITENFLILVLHVTLVLPLEGILLQNQDCGQCIAPLEHQVALLQQRLETLEQSKLMHFFNLKFKKLIVQISEPHRPYKEKADAHLTQTESF